MKVDLIELLKTREIVHPSLLTEVHLEGGTASFKLRGYQWWRADRIQDEADYEFFFSEITQGHINPSIAAEYAEILNDALEEFSLISLEQCDWAKPRNCDIYCNAPIKDSVAMFSAVEEHLREIDSFWPASEFLNQGETLSAFSGLTRSTSFLLAKCPPGLCDLIVRELECQGVAHNVLRHSQEIANDDRLRVRLDGSDFLCRSAVAVLPD